MSANFMSAAVCPFPPLSTEITVPKDLASITVYVWRTMYASISLSVMGMVIGKERDNDAHTRTAPSGKGAERPEARLLRRWRRALSARRTRWPTVEGMTKLEAIESAMSDLNRLFSEKKEFSWARAWFTGIGHNETNPETLMVLVQLLGTNTKALRQLTADIQSSMGE